MSAPASLTKPPEHTLKTKVIHSGMWLYGRSIVTNFINLGVMAILARQLSPAEFGLVAIAQVALRFVTVIGAEGVSEYVIYDNEDGREERVYAAFWMDMTFSVAGAAVGLLLIPLIVRFYDEPKLVTILIAMLLRYPLDSLSKVPDALLKKRLDFERLVIRDTVLEILSSCSMVVLALAGVGVWSLIIPPMVVSPIRAVIVFIMAKWRPRLHFYVRMWPKIFTYSANVIGGTFVSMLTRDGDTLLVGKLLGNHALGVYNLAWVASNLVVNNLVGTINKLMLPAFSAVAKDLTHLQTAFSRTLSIVSISTFPLLIGLFVVADDFILTLYGPQWKNAILPLRIFTIYAIRYAVGAPTGVLYKSVGRTDISFKLGLATAPFYLASIWIGSHYDIVGVTVSVTIVRTVFGLISFELAARCLKVSFADVIKPIIPALIASCDMGLIVFMGAQGLDLVHLNSHVVRLLLLVALGGLAYLALLRSVFHKLASELVETVKPLLGSYHRYARWVLNVR